MKKYSSIKGKLIKSLNNDPYNKYLNYDIMNKLSDFSKSKKESDKIAYEYNFLDTNELWDDDLMNKETVHTNKPKAIAIYKRMSDLVQQFIESLN